MTAISPEPDLRLQIKSDPHFLSGIRGMVASIAERVGLASTCCSQVALAIDEALCNVIRHGYDRRPDAPIWVSLWVLNDPVRGAGLKIVIEDEARHIEPDQIKSRNLEDVRPGGLGVHIIREVMDSAVYEKRSPIGMRLTLTKFNGPQSRIVVNGSARSDTGVAQSGAPPMGGSACGGDTPGRRPPA